MAALQSWALHPRASTQPEQGASHWVRTAEPEGQGLTGIAARLPSLIWSTHQGSVTPGCLLRTCSRAMLPGSQKRHCPSFAMSWPSTAAEPPTLLPSAASLSVHAGGCRARQAALPWLLLRSATASGRLLSSLLRVCQAISPTPSHLVITMTLRRDWVGGVAGTVLGASAEAADLHITTDSMLGGRRWRAPAPRTGTPGWRRRCPRRRSATAWSASCPAPRPRCAQRPACVAPQRVCMLHWRACWPLQQARSFPLSQEGSARLCNYLCAQA